MSEPVRIVTPRLQAALEEAVRLLDALLKLALDPAAAGAVAGLRAELLEAFEEARVDGQDNAAQTAPERNEG